MKQKGSSRTTAALKNVIDNLNLYKKLPWNVRREQERHARQLRRDAAQLYRELGIPEDATFEDINEATEALKRKYRDNLKKQIKIDIIKDKIMQLRLEQRMGGLVGESREARADTALTKSAAAYRRKKSVEFTPPKWTRGLVVKPNSTWRDTCVTVYASLAVIGLVFTGTAGGMSFASFIMGTGLMGSRGARDEFNPNARGIRGARSELGWHTVQALVFALFVFLFTYFTALFITSNSSLAGNPIEKPLINVACQGTMFLASLYMKFYRGDKSSTAEDED